MTGFGERSGGAGRRLRRAAVLGVAAAALLAVLPMRHGARATPPPVREIGFMRFGFDARAAQPMAVDSVLHRGFYAGNDDHMHVYDLKALKKIGRFPITQIGSTFAVDEANHRIFYRSSGPAPTCADSTLVVIDTRTFKVATPQVPCYGRQSVSFYVRGISYYAPANKLYVIGAGALESALLEISGVRSYRESTVIRQLDADTLALDWEIDLSDRCDTNTNTPSAADPVVGRSARGVISYCYVGGQGRAVWIPLVSDRPVTGGDGNAVVRVSPAVGRSTTPIVDSGSGRLLILEDRPPFGPGVWVYDPEAQRFHGVVPSGVSLDHEGVRYDYWRGFAGGTGRLYIQNRKGLVLADVRATPLPPGVSYPVLTNRTDGISPGPISIDARLGRLFYPYPGRGGFVVVADEVPLARRAAADDPDAGTADIPEADGKTGRTFSSEATAFGVHVVNVGGIPRLVNNADALCTSESGINDRDEFGRCPADRVVTPGNREFFVASSSLESGSDSGAVAAAHVLRFASADAATDSDVRSIGRCGADRGGDLVAPVIAGACPNGEGQPLEPVAAGTQGTGGKGYPIPGAICTDFDGTKATDRGGDSPLGRAAVTCDSGSGAAEGSASAAAVEIPGVLSVASTSSSVTTRATPKGVETITTAVASGVEIGGQIVIGRIATTAVTRAHGRTGTTIATFARDYSDVRGPGIRCAECDPAAVADAINRLLGAQMRARVPDAHVLASPRGYQGIVAKEPGLIASDKAVNDDDTITVNGLDVIVYNDSSPANRGGSAGRSRVIVSLAGVEAESRYGIYLLPDAGEIPGDAGSVVVFDPAPDIGGADPATEDPRPERPRPGMSAGPAGPAGPAEAIVRSFAFVRNRPGEFGMLFVLWSLLAAPAYLALRRRAMSRVLDV